MTEVTGSMGVLVTYKREEEQAEGVGTARRIEATHHIHKT